MAQSLLDSRSDSAITRHLKSHHNCLRAVCGPNMLDHFSILSRARNQFHLDVLEAVYIKVHNPELCQQKEYVKVLYLVQHRLAGVSSFFSTIYYSYFSHGFSHCFVTPFFTPFTPLASCCFWPFFTSLDRLVFGSPAI